MKRVAQQISHRAFATSAPCAAAAAVKTDNPKFYAMVLEFTEGSAKILEKKLLSDTTIGLGRSENVKLAQMEAYSRSEDQRKKSIRGIFDFMLPCNSILETNFRVKMDDGSTRVSDHSGKRLFEFFCDKNRYYLVDLKSIRYNLLIKKMF
jgi:hypothetical protein